MLAIGLDKHCVEKRQRGLRVIVSGSGFRAAWYQRLPVVKDRQLSLQAVLFEGRLDWLILRPPNLITIACLDTHQQHHGKASTQQFFRSRHVDLRKHCAIPLLRQVCLRSPRPQYPSGSPRRSL